MAPLNVLMVGTGEYTTGFVGGKASGSDKKVGVVGLTLFDLRRRGKVGKLSMAGTSGTKFPAIREHLHKNITRVYNQLDTSFASFPSDDTTRDPEAYITAIDALSPGDAVTIFTPDDTHFSIAKYAISKGLHVLITKPAVKLLTEHQSLLRLAREANVLVFVEQHKRFDPAYADARHRALTSLGHFNHFSSYMSQPVSQLETFRAWAGKDSDISYYLNSHHVDVCASMAPSYRPVRVTAAASTGVAEGVGCSPGTEDTITLLVEWEEESSKRKATGVYTASWTAPRKAGVHSQQYFHYLAEKGEVRVDQAKRGYDVTEDDGDGVSWLNPFYMKYAPDERGDFAGQTGYGYISFEKFVDAVAELKAGETTLDQLDVRGLPTLKNTLANAAVLNAGRVSLDERRSVDIQISGDQWSLV